MPDQDNPYQLQPQPVQPQPAAPPQQNFLQQILGGISGGLGAYTGMISPMQAQALGMPQAAGMTMQQLQMLVQQPERSAQLQQTQLQNQGMQQQLAQGGNKKTLTWDQAAFSMDPTADKD